MKRPNSLDLLTTLVGFDTTSYRSNLQLIEWVATYLPDLGVMTDQNHGLTSDDTTVADAPSG